MFYRFKEYRSTTSTGSRSTIIDANKCTLKIFGLIYDWIFLLKFAANFISFYLLFRLVSCNQQPFFMKSNEIRALNAKLILLLICIFELIFIRELKLFRYESDIALDTYFSTIFAKFLQNSMTSLRPILRQTHREYYSFSIYSKKYSIFEYCEQF